MNDIIQAEQLPVAEKVYMKKTFMGWKVVHPIKNEDGSINWFNLITGGSWWNVFFTAVAVGVMSFFFYEYASNIDHFLNCFASPVNLEACKAVYSNWSINIG